MSKKERYKVTARTRETQGGIDTILRGVLGSTPDGKKIYVEFSPENPFFGRVFAEGNEENASRIDFGKQVFIDGSGEGLIASDVILKVSEMMEQWERKVALAGASTEELLQALWDSLTIRG